VIILDTNVISELLGPAPAAAVEAWLADRDGANVYFTAVGEAGLRYGVASLPAGRRRRSLFLAIDGILEEDFRDRIGHSTGPQHLPMPVSLESGAPRVARSVSLTARSRLLRASTMRP